MRPIVLDFVPPPRLGNAAGIMLFAIGVGLLAATALDVQGWMQTRDDLLARRDAAARRIHEAGRPVAAVPARPEETRALRDAGAIAARLTLPWQRLFDETAEAAAGEVALTGLQPDAATRTVRIGGLAKDLAAVNAFVERLQAKPGFEYAYLAQHEAQRKEADASLGFVVLANWREEG